MATPTDLGPLLDQLQASLERKDLGGIRAALTALEAGWLDLVDRRPSLTRDTLQVLRQSAGLDEYQDLLKLHVFDRPAVYQFFARLEPPAATAELLRVVETVGMPEGGEGEREFCELLVRREDREVTDFLAAWIEREAAKHAASGDDYQTYVRRFATGGQVHLPPRDAPLAAAVGILARRADDRVPELLRGYLERLPWGQDRLTTIELVRILSQQSTPENQATLRRVVHHTPAPGPVRHYLLAGLSVSCPAEVLRLVLEDLGEEMANETRLLWLRALEDLLGRVEPAARDDRRLGQLVGQLDTATWPVLTRGLLGVILTDWLPEVDGRGLSRGFDRLLARAALLTGWGTGAHSLPRISALSTCLSRSSIFLWALSTSLSVSVLSSAR